MSGARAVAIMRMGQSDFIIAAIAGGLLATPLLRWVLRSGLNMVPHDLATDYVTGALWATAIAVTIFAWPIPFADRWTLFLLWIVKAAVALGFMLFYESSYSSLDAYSYFVASLQPHFDWSRAGWGNGTQNVEAVAWLHGRLFPNSYHALKISFALIGMVASYIFYRSALIAGAKKNARLLILLLLTPSILFWSSIVAKEPIVLLGVALYSYGIVRMVRDRRLIWLLLVFAGVFLASLFRIWLGPILTLPVIPLFLLGKHSALQRIVLLLAGAAAFAVAVSIFRDKFLRGSTVDVVEATNMYSQAWAYGGSAQVLATPFSGIGAVLRFLPLGIFTALFRPLPGEVKNAFGLLAGLENALILILGLVALWRTKLRDFRDPLVLWATALMLTWSAIYGFISYQNLGSGVRFRLQVLPIFLLLLLHLARPRLHTVNRVLE